MGEFEEIVEAKKRADRAKHTRIEKCVNGYTIDIGLLYEVRYVAKTWAEVISILEKYGG